MELLKYGGFGQISKNFFNERLVLSFGLRLDGNSYSKEMQNPLKQLSPRFSASYSLTSKLAITFNSGRYYQLPPYTTLGFKNNQGEFINKQNKVTYISADHIVGGIDFTPDEKSKFTLEGFYKNYNHYPFSVKDSISLASKGGDFGTYGDEELVSTSKGRAYGIEAFYRNNDLYAINLIFSYTYVRSEFLNASGKYIPSSWDTRHILNITATRKLKGDWDVGLKWRFVGGTPYTPYDEYKSSLVSAWSVLGREYLDYKRYNTLRLKPFHQLDIRVDKSFFFKKWTLMAYLDIQNVYNFKSDMPYIYLREFDSNGNPIIFFDQGIPRYKMKYVKSEGGGNVLPTIGIIVEF